MITLNQLTKIYRTDEIETLALENVNLEVKKGEFISIMGPSGCGKSTLLNLIGLLDNPTSGSITINGTRTDTMNEKQLAAFRNQQLGFVFQSFNLLPRATALANVELPMRYAGQIKDRQQRAKEALESVGLAERVTHRPTELSGGQQQRVAIARALVNNPAILMADEPTGNLDSKSGKEIMELLLNLNKTKGTTLIIVTHDPTIAEQTQRVIRLRDGLIEEARQ